MRRSPSCLGLLAWLDRVVPRLVCRPVGRGGLPFDTLITPLARVVWSGRSLPGRLWCRLLCLPVCAFVSIVCCLLLFVYIVS